MVTPLFQGLLDGPDDLIRHSAYITLIAAHVSYALSNLQPIEHVLHGIGVQNLDHFLCGSVFNVGSMARDQFVRGLSDLRIEFD
jgi:hypothetical protein